MMAVDGVDGVVEKGRNPVSRHQIQLNLSAEKDQAGAGRDRRTCLERQNSQARTRTGKNMFFPVQLTLSRIGNHIRLIHTLLKVVLTIHTQ